VSLSPADMFMVLLLVVAVLHDLTTRRIPNWLVLVGITAALGANLYQGGLEGVLFSLKGLGLGLALLFIPFAMGGMGAGDVKLLGMVGAFQGAIFVFNAFLWMALFGGAMAILYLIKTGQMLEFLQRLGRGAVLALTGGRGQIFLQSVDKKPFAVFFPYGLAIGLGALAAFYKGWC